MSDTIEDLGNEPSGAMAYAEESHKPGTCFSDGPMLPEMVIIPAGKFWMGVDDPGDQFSSAVKPRHWVEIARSIAVSRSPITFEQWDLYADGNGDVHRPEDRGLGRGRRPVVSVSWEDAQEYVTWLSMSAGRVYRLLSEAEWEYCCRSEFGLFDVRGDMGELVADSWHDSYRGAPTDGSAWGATEATMWRVVRGGAGDGQPRIRERVHHTKRMENVGFRVACDLR